MFGLEYNTAIVLAGTLLLGLAAGVMGCLTLLRGRALLGDALAHSTLPGICLAFLITGSRSYPALLGGALLTGLLGVVCVNFLTRSTRIKQDCATGIVLSVFFGVGIVLSTHIQQVSSDGAQAGIESFLLGKTAGMLWSDLLVLVSAASVVLLTVVACYKELQLLCFDRDFAAVSGNSVHKLDLLVLLLLGITTVIGLPAVGVVLMVAMLIIPAAAARLWAERFGTLLVVAGILGMLSGALGTLASSHFQRLPAGPVIVLTATALFVLSLLLAPRRGFISRALLQRQLRLRRLEQSLCRTLYDLTEKNFPKPLSFRPADLLKARGWSETTASKLLRRFERRGWLQRWGQDWQLTREGVEQCVRVTRARRLWDVYLRTCADIDRDLVDPDSLVIERLLPPSLVLSLEQELRQRGRLPSAEGVAT